MKDICKIMKCLRAVAEFSKNTRNWYEN